MTNNMTDDEKEFEEYVEQVDSSISSKDNMKKLQQYHDNPTIELRNNIVVDNLGLVISIAKDYANTNHIEIMDLIQEGSLGLINAVEDYDINKGFAFSTFATPYIKNAIRAYLSKHSHLITIPSWVQAKKRKVQNAVDTLTMRLERTPTSQEIVDFLNDGTTVNDIDNLLFYYKDVYSLDYNLSENNDDKLSLYDLIADDSCSPSELALLKEKKALLKEAISILPERSREILLARNSPDGQKTLKELADKYHLSNERIRQLEASAKASVIKYIKERL